jgi:aspartyl-tRNA(Asn)/glutamyl-tRNA(Gln) amidotransferase subunit C
MIDREQVLYIAALARLKLTDTEVEHYAGQLNDIIGYMEQLNSADTSSVEPTAFISPAHDPLREDIPQKSLNAGELCSNGPEIIDGFFGIPKVIGV